MTSSPYQQPRIQTPSLHVLAIDAPVLWPLFSAHRAVIRALQQEDQGIDVREYRDHMGWIGGLWSRPLLAAKGELITEDQIKQCEKLLTRVSADSPIRRVILEARHARANKEATRFVAEQICESICLWLSDAEPVIAVESRRARCTLQALDALRGRLEMPPIQRARAWPKHAEEVGVALLFGAPRFDDAPFRWAFWPPVAPTVLQVVWKPLATNVSPYLDWLAPTHHPWVWRVTQELILLSAPCKVSVVMDAPPSDQLPEELSDGWHMLQAGNPAKALALLRRERFFRRLDSQVRVSDARNNQAPATPFLLAVDSHGQISESDGPPVEQGAVWILARPTGSESLADREKVHAFPELRDFKRLLRHLPHPARADAIAIITDKKLMRQESAESNFNKWCSSRPEDPYLPRSDDIFDILARAVRLSERASKLLRRKVDAQVSLHLAAGLSEAHAWRTGAECNKLDLEVLAQLQRGDEVDLTVTLGESLFGTLELVPISDELDHEWQD